MDFSKITSNIAEEYKNITGITEFDIADMNTVNNVLFTYINSYYFKDLYFGVHMKETVDGYQIPYLLKNDNLSMEISDINGETIDIRKIEKFDDIDKANLTSYDILEAYQENTLDQSISIEKISKKGLSFATPNPNGEIANKIITALSEKDPFYAIVFEQNPVKRVLNNTAKRTITITKIDCEGLKRKEIHDKLTEFNKTPDKRTVELLTENYGIKYLSNLKRAKSIYIAHNDNQIAGLLVTDKNFHLESVGVIDVDKFNYVETISVTKPFVGLGLATRMYESLINDMKSENGIIFMSNFSENGSKYIEEKFNEINRRNPEVTIVQYSEQNNYAYPLIETLFRNKNNTFYHHAKETDLPQVERSFDESMKLLKSNLDLAKILSPKEFEMRLNSLMDDSIKSYTQKQKIKPL